MQFPVFSAVRKTLYLKNSNRTELTILCDRVHCIHISLSNFPANPTLDSCTMFCRQNIISGDPDLWKRAYIKEKHSSIATEIWPHFTSDVEVPSTPQTTEKCNVSENIRQAASWKRAAVAAFTWRRFHSGPITSIAVKACSDRYSSQSSCHHTSQVCNHVLCVAFSPREQL